MCYRRILAVIALVLPALFGACATTGDSGLQGAVESEFGRYLIQLETSVRLDAQTPGWVSRRPGWMRDVRVAGNDVGRLARLLVEFEREVQAGAQTPDWFAGNRREMWIHRAMRSASIAELAGLMLEAEASIRFDAQFDTWRTRRQAWVDGVRSLQSAVPRPVLPRPDTNSFARLLVELETSVLFESQSPQWRTLRPSWLSRVQGAGSDIPSLKALLLEFEQHIKVGSQSREWVSRNRGRWVSRVRAASTVAELSTLMLEVEATINYQAQVPAWRAQRDGWMSRVRELQRSHAGEFY